MRKLYTILFLLAIITSVSSQNKVTVKTDPKNSTKTETKTDAKTSGKGTGKPADNKDKTEKIPDGYGNLTWGMYLSEAKDKISGVLTYTDEKKIIISKDKEMEYYYGFFYKEPADTAASSVKEETPAGDKQPAVTPEKDEGRLFYVSMNFPYLDKDLVYEKIQKKYGNHTGENIKDNQGAIAWDSPNTVIIMWVDRYEKKPFCRKIIYLSKPIAKELNDYTNSIFNKSEIDMINRMNP